MKYSVIIAVLAVLLVGLPATAQYSVIELYGEDTMGVVGEADAEDLGITGNNPKTVEVWVHITDWGHEGGIFDTGLCGGEAPRELAIRVIGEQWYGPNVFRVQLCGGDLPDFEYPSLNRWVHLALVGTEDETIVYADGQEVSRGSALNTAAGTPFRAGWRDSKWSPGEDSIRSIMGYLDDVRVWNVARTQEEIQATMHEYLTGDEEGLVLYWPFNEGEGDTTADLTGNNNVGDLNDATWLSIDEAPDLTGLTLEDALAELDALGLEIELGETTGEGDIIVGHNPPPGGRFVSGQVVDVEFGEVGEPVEVPDLVIEGWTLEDVEAALTAAGLNVGTITQVHSDDVPEGQVIGQEPAAGSELPEGSSVNLTISRGPAPTDMPLSGLAVLLMVLAVMAAALGSKALLHRVK